MKNKMIHLPRKLSINNDSTEHKALFALWSAASYAFLACSVYMYTKFDQNAGSLFLFDSAISLFNGLHYGIKAENDEKALNDLKASGKQHFDNEQSK